MNKYLEWQPIILLKVGEKSFLQTRSNILKWTHVRVDTEAACKNNFVKLIENSKSCLFWGHPPLPPLIHCQQK